MYTVNVEIKNKDAANEIQREVMFKMYGSLIKVWKAMGYEKATFIYKASDNGKLYVVVLLDGIRYEERLIGPRGKIYAN